MRSERTRGAGPGGAAGDSQGDAAGASAWTLGDDPTGRLVDICKRLGADTYLSGAGGQGYLDLSQFEAAGIRVAFQAFEHPVYPQRFGPFEPFMSVADLLFNCGAESLEIVRRGRRP